MCPHNSPFSYVFSGNKERKPQNIILLSRKTSVPPVCQFSATYYANIARRAAQPMELMVLKILITVMILVK
jgi:hypothetical protein